MICFFNDELILKAYLKEDIFDTPAICKMVKKNINTEFMDIISKTYQQIEHEKITNSSHPLAKRHANFFSKLGFIISSKIIGEASEAFANILMKCYLNYAHVWPVIHSYRMWILQVCKETIETKAEDKIGSLRGLSVRLCQQILG